MGTEPKEGEEDHNGKTRIAILGGGMGSLAAAWYLSDSQELRDHYEITVYQMGWRLGGKGSSGRNCNAGMGDRIEEHGIHYFFGFYENAFHLMRRCADEMVEQGLKNPGDPLSHCFEGDHPVFRKIEEVESGNPVVPSRLNATMMELLGDEWDLWELGSRNSSGYPGEKFDTDPGWFRNRTGKDDRWRLFKKGLRWLRNYHFNHLRDLESSPGHQEEPVIRGMRLNDYFGSKPEGKSRFDTVYDNFLDRSPESISDEKVDRDLFGLVFESLDVPDDIHLLDLLLVMVENENPELPGIKRRSDQTDEEKERNEELQLEFERIYLFVFERALAVIGARLDRFQKEHLPHILTDDPGSQHEKSNQNLSETLRRWWLIARFGAAFFLAQAKDRVWKRGYDSVEEWEFVNWIVKRGKTSEKVARFPMIQALYAMGYSYDPNNVQEWSMGAGTITRIIIRLMFDCTGGLAWRMQGGMGDAVFAPLYLMLKHRGVKFRFFHRVRNLSVGEKDGRKVIDRVDFAKQVKMANGGDLADYNPLEMVNGLDCWPSEPLYDQIDPQQATQLRSVKADKDLDLESAWIDWRDEETDYSITLGTDDNGGESTFDHVILGISIGAFPAICEELIADSPSWENMVEELDTIEVASVQTWMRKTPREMGWKGSLKPLTLCFRRPIDVWHDFSHLCPLETLEGVGVKQISYFCDVLEQSDPPPFFFEPDYDSAIHQDFPMTRRNLLRDIFRDDYLLNGVEELWTNIDPADFPWDWFHDSQDRYGQGRLDWHYFRPNINPSDRYVLWRPGKLAFRMRPDESGYANLYLAGDWTKNGFNAGSVEAACMSGMQASRAISNHPRTVFGEDI